MKPLPWFALQLQAWSFIFTPIHDETPCQTVGLGSSPGRRTNHPLIPMLVVQTSLIVYEPKGACKSSTKTPGKCVLVIVVCVFQPYWGGGWLESIKSQQFCLYSVINTLIWRMLAESGQLSFCSASSWDRARKNASVVGWEDSNNRKLLYTSSLLAASVCCCCFAATAAALWCSRRLLQMLVGCAAVAAVEGEGRERVGGRVGMVAGRCYGHKTKSAWNPLWRKLDSWQAGGLSHATGCK